MIVGDNIRFRKVERHDIQRFVTWFNDPEVREGLSGFLPMSVMEEEKWLEEMLTQPNEERPFVIEILENQEWVVIGNCCFFDINWRIRSAEIGIVIGEKEYWNKGFGTKAMKLCVDLGFRSYNLNRLYLQVFETNPRAIKCYEKAGFMQEGLQRDGYYQNGEYIDVIQMSILRCEWKE